MNRDRIFRPEFLPSQWARLPEFTLKSSAVDLEIGAGVGWHAITYSKSHPDRHLIALEHGRERFQKMHRRWVHNGRPGNLEIYSMGVVPFSCFYLPENSVERIFILYPNPYPKVSQKRKRFHAMPFMKELLKKLKAGGTLELRSNVLAYAQEALEDYQKQGLRLLRHELISKVLRPDFCPETHFELKYFKAGEVLHHLVFLKD
jgi:tRNA (guanine-N7-)-methyltransferase